MASLFPLAKAVATWAFDRLRLRKRAYVPPNAVDAELATRQFLSNVAGAAARYFPGWLATLSDGLSEAAPGADIKATFLDRFPVDDMFFAGLAALEAARVPQLYSADEADVVLGEIADTIDRAAGRNDRLLSDIFFEVIARLNLLRTSGDQKQPYDKVVKVLLKRLDFDKTDAGQALLADKGFRHQLAEPFALHPPQWWENFRKHFVLHRPAPAQADEDADEKAIADAIAATEAARLQKQPVTQYRRRWRKRATAMFG
ncbi:MAG: hypothetical protein SFV19_05880 [Rhodospirillaceae bacterium]|nr:hypothetical protein [Rhodospirillaceae bacterium]